MRAIRLTLAALTCALLAGCGTDDLVTPEMDARFTDTDCTDGVCGDPSAPAYDWGSETTTTLEGCCDSSGSYTVHRAWSWTTINDDLVYSSGRVDAVVYRYYQCKTSYKREHYRGSQTVYGAGTARVYTRYDATSQYGFQILGTHRITARPGYYGGGTFYSEASHCDNGFPAG